MTSHRISILSGIAAVMIIISAIPRPAHAVLLDIIVTGEVTGITGGPPLAAFSLGDSMSATMTYDTDVAFSVIGPATSGTLLDAIVGGSFTVGSRSGVFEGGFIRLFDDDPIDGDGAKFRASVDALSGGPLGLERFGLDFLDASGSAFPMFTLPTSAAELSLLPFQRWNWSGSAVPPFIPNSVGGVFTSIEIRERAAVIPEPSTVALFLLGLGMVALSQRPFARRKKSRIVLRF